ncbi:MAG: phosphodiester glycosidase family protein [Polyangiaceae bacterium]
MNLSDFSYRFAGGEGSVWCVELNPAQVHLDLVQAERPKSLRDVVGARLPAGDYAVINGGFYGRDERPMGWVVARGKQLAPKTRSGGSGIFLLEAENRARIVHRDAKLPKELPQLGLQSIDRLVDDGSSLVRPRESAPRDARSAIVVHADGTVALALAFDTRAVARREGNAIYLGAASSSTGLTLGEWADLLARPRGKGGIGAKTALNLDGGLSSSMLVKLGEFEGAVHPHRATTNALVAVPR